MATNEFQNRLAQRRAELVDPTITASLEERFAALTQMSLDKLMAHIDRPAVEIDPEILIKAASLGAKSLGIGGHAAPKQSIISEDERLAVLSGRLTSLLNQKKTEGQDVMDVTVKEIPDDTNISKEHLT